MAEIQALKYGATLQNGTYIIEKVLGQGGFGITYLATDMNLQRKVAIKEFFPKDFCDREETTNHVTLGTQHTVEFVTRLKAKFLKEARNIAKFNHPNIIRIFAAFEENNTAYYVMEYIEGESLSAMVKCGGPLPSNRAIDYIEKVGAALEYVHARKMNHLDVKPANIMVRRSEDTPVLIDFGLSKQYDSEGNQTSTIPPGFSHGFAPLEQYNEGGVKDFTHQTDIYSLAATLYYMLSGIVPLQATRRNDEELTFPATIPQKLIAPISKAMSPGRKGRHEEVARFLSDLKSASGVSSCHIEVTAASPVCNLHHAEPKPAFRLGVKKRNIAPYVISGCVIIAFVVVILIWAFATDGVETVPERSVKTVADMEWRSPLGEALYTGEVWPDTLATGEVVMIPHGKGIAKIKAGALTGALYDGTFVSGEMEGQSTYTMPNGDVFTGTFHRNQFDKGKYLNKESGEYFEGAFRDALPYKGIWYSVDGNVLEEVPPKDEVAKVMEEIEEEANAHARNKKIEHEYLRLVRQLDSMNCSKKEVEEIERFAMMHELNIPKVIAESSVKVKAYKNFFNPTMSPTKDTKYFTLEQQNACKYYEQYWNLHKMHDPVRNFRYAAEKLKEMGYY